MAKKRSSTTTVNQTETQKTEEQAQTEETKTATDESQTDVEGTQTEGGETQQASGEDTQQADAGDGSQSGEGDDGGDVGAGETSQETGDVTATGGDGEGEDDAAAEEPEAEVATVDSASVLMEAAPEGMGGIGYKLGGYIDAMQPNQAQDEGTLQKNQLKLRGVINNVLDLADDRFADGLKFLVGAVREHRKTVFSETMVFRGFDRLKVSRGERQRLETLISLLLATADVKNPKDVSKSVDMKVVYRFVTDNNQQQKLQSYYGA